MRRWIRCPDRIDVILPPRKWRFKRYSRGVIIIATGQFQRDGTAALNAFRLGPPASRTKRV